MYLAEAGVEYALVGGYALGAHGISRLTEDIDILVDPDPENSRRWIVALSRLPDGAARALADSPDVFAKDRRYAVRVNDEFTVDVMPAIAGHGWEQMKPHVVERTIDDVVVRVLDLEGLLATKQGLRPKDQMDARTIRAAIDALREAGGGEGSEGAK
jgi:hypothetical protein